MRHNYLGHKVVWFWSKLCPNCTILLKQDFWGKLTNANFVNILCPITQKYFKIPKTTIIWGTVPEIQSETNLFCHFGPIFALQPPIQKTKIFEKRKKASGDVIILTLCNKKHKMMYAYSDMECNRHNFLSFQAIFCSFTPLLTPKIKFWKKCKKHLEILSFYT